MDVAVLDDDGTLTMVLPVDAQDWVSDPTTRRVALPINHDMRDKVGRYGYDWNRGCFMPISVRQRGPYRRG